MGSTSKNRGAKSGRQAAWHVSGQWYRRLSAACLFACCLHPATVSAQATPTTSITPHEVGVQALEPAAPEAAELEAAEPEAAEPENTGLETVDTAGLENLAGIENVPPAADSELNFLSSQIAAGEANEALATLDQRVVQLESEHHRYHTALFEPIMLRGDAYLALEQFEQALNEYGRARHIARVSHGLFDARQIPAVYREAEVLKRTGDLINAGKREEYAYEVARRAYDDYDHALLPSTIRLADFYMDSGNPLAARTLLNRAHLIHERHDTLNTDEAVNVLRAIAKSHRLERFPPVYIDRDDDAGSVYAAQLRTRDLEDQFEYVNSFPAGERALQQVIAIQQERYGEDSQQALDAMLELADWHLMFGRAHVAHTLYQHIYLTVDGEQSSGAGDRMFAEPVLLHFPRPPNPKPPAPAERGDAAEGSVALSFDVSRTGGVKKLKTVEIDGPKNMNFRVRRSMREAIFRPRLEAGSVVTAEQQTFRYYFPYFMQRQDLSTDDEAVTAATLSGEETIDGE